MAPQCAKDQLTGFTNRIERVAIVGVSGNLGKHFAKELLKTGKHTVTALTRADSKGPPDAIKVVVVDYDNEDSLVSALKGQQFLVITLSVFAPPDTHSKIVKAAVKAGVPYIMPNSYGSDIMNESLRKEDLYGEGALERCKEIEALGSSYIALLCGFWYKWSLSLGSFGFDIANKKATFFDDGKTYTNISTWEQCGRALAGLLSLKELPEDANDKSPTISQWKNKPLYISSFRITQRDMLDSIHRNIGTTDSDWTIEYEPSAQRYKDGIEAMKKGDRQGFAKAMYSRTFFPNGGGDFETSRGLANSAIGLKDDDLDEATKRAVDMVKAGFNPFKTS
ncbi:hypothetical protein G7Y89_g8318 [Cudoniella acicularis]|uniref:NAD(P)-binding domain-containing protein n=1 Tax=Cudoniella acicularis TaxID=354080 RepID=A0A8H4RGU6_9HELO|nr:hypothetical protein G7Y89_g8318 [Cudoniella acicularis]